MEKISIWDELAVYAQRAPSPHNTQPTRLKVIDDSRAEVYFQRERGLPVGDPKGRFTFATFGIFIEILSIAAASKGYRLDVEYHLKPLYQTDELLQKIASLELVKDTSVSDIDAELILKRHTSRLPYSNQSVSDEVLSELRDEAAKFGNTISVRNDKQAIKWVIELNKDSVFYDLSHKTYREELRVWLRYSHKEAVNKKDGLAAEAMYLPGWLVKSFMYKHWLYTAPGFTKLAQYIYIKTMKGVSTIAWIQGPYLTMDDWVRSGRLMIRLWLIMTKHGVYWQPYGSVITNDEARTKMIRNFAINDEDGGKNMVWLLLRMGFSGEPIVSERLPIKEIMI